MQTINQQGAKPLVDLIDSYGGWYALGSWEKSRWDFDFMMNVLLVEQKIPALFGISISRDIDSQSSSTKYIGVSVLAFALGHIYRC